ncbi:translationally-controlled tumor protein homolog [Halichoeres trimaculatus]|uniref:translationally-controlled tumor protein homolog n=1 Tax=Halichoeres trimaculatus TaxID=147232 RepID=UPI003D9FA214
MIIYKCIITNDEMFSDIYKVKVSECGTFYEVDGKTVTRTESFDDALIGANASAEEPTETNDSSCVSGVDIVLNHNLKETTFNKKSYMGYVKEYVKNIKKRLEESDPDSVKKFTESCNVGVKKVLADFDNFQFFTGESMNPDGMVGLLNYRPEDDTPYMLFFKQGLEVEKC